MSTAITATGEKPLTSAALRELSARSNLQGIVRAVSHYGAIGVFGTLIWLVSSTYGIAWALPLMVVQGYFVAFLFMVVHETAHKTAFRSRALNLALGHLSSFAIGLPYEYYCLFHWDHHRYTQDPDRDPELLVGPKPASDTQLAIAYTGLRQVAFRVGLMLRHAFTGNASAALDPRSKRHIVVREARLYVACYVAAAARLAGAPYDASALGLDHPADRRPAIPAALSLCRTHRLRTNAQRLSEHPHHLHRHGHEMVCVEHALSRRASCLSRRSRFMRCRS